MSYVIENQELRILEESRMKILETLYTKFYQEYEKGNLSRENYLLLIRSREGVTANIRIIFCYLDIVCAHNSNNASNFISLVRTLTLSELSLFGTVLDGELTIVPYSSDNRYFSFTKSTFCKRFEYLGFGHLLRRDMNTSLNINANDDANIVRKLRAQIDFFSQFDYVNFDSTDAEIFGFFRDADFSCAGELKLLIDVNFPDNIMIPIRGEVRKELNDCSLVLDDIRKKLN